MRIARTLLAGSLMVGACGLSACERAGDAGDARADGRGDAPANEAAMTGFSWVIEDQVAGMPRPGAGRPLEQDLQFLQDQRIDVLVSLTEAPVDPVALEAHGIEPMHLPVADFHAPTQDQLDRYIAAVQAWTAEGRVVGTHCAAGLGRTGTFLAALLVARGRTAEEAIAEVRRLRPGSIETKAQEDAVRQLALRRAGAR